MPSNLEKGIGSGKERPAFENQNNLTIRERSPEEIGTSLVSSYKRSVDLGIAISMADEIKNASVYLNLANTIREMGEDPVPVLKKAGTLGGNDHVWKMQLAIAFAKSGDTSMLEKVSKSLNQLEDDGEDSTLQQMLGMLAEFQTNSGLDPTESYAKLAQIAKARDYNASKGLIVIAKSMAKHGVDPSSVLEEAEKLIDKDERRYHYGELAMVYAKMGKDEKARYYLQKAHEESPGYIARNDVLYELALFYINNGDIEPALKIVDDVGTIETKALLLSRIAKKIAQEGEDPSSIVDRAIKETDKITYGSSKLYVYLTLAEAELVSQGNVKAMLDRAVATLEIDENLLYDISILSRLARTQRQVGRNTKRTVDLMYQAIESIFSEIPPDADPNDDNYKLERIEAIMAIEDTVDTLIDLGYFDQAKRLIHEYRQRCLLLDELVEIDEFSPNAFARVAKEESKTVLSLNEINSLTRQDIQMLISSRNSETIEALAYFDLLREEDIEDLTPESRLSVTMGRSKRGGVEDGSFEDIEKNFQKSESVSASRVLTRNLTFLDSAQLKSQIKNLLRNTKNPQAARRLLKGLLETKDEGAMLIASELFADENTPSAFKMYLAKKLCGLGLWDRQITFYFRSIREGVDNLEQVQMETLGALVNQMHITPSLSIYKILEKTRLARGKNEFSEVAKLGAKVFSLTRTSLETKIAIFSHWTDKFLTEAISLQGVDRLSQVIGSFRDIEDEFLEKAKLHVHDKKIQTMLRQIYTADNLLNDHVEVALLMRSGFYPTQLLIQYLKENYSKSIHDLAQLKELTLSGRFDPSNGLQRELEFTTFLKLSDQIAENAYELFRKIEYFPDSEITRELSLREKVEAEAAALEAANFYWLVRTRVEAGRKVVVIGNQRYGDYFVMEPLRNEFQDLGVRLNSFKVSSSGSNENSLPDVLPVSFIEYITNETPDVVIVDATPNYKDQEGNPRLPSAFYGYLNWFRAYNAIANKESEVVGKESEPVLNKIKSANPENPYHIAQWVPVTGGKITIGNTAMEYSEPNFRGPNVILANTIIDPKRFEGYPEELTDHTPGFLDDPERHLGSKKILVFINTGLRTIVEGSIDEIQFATSIQNHMTRVLPRLIRQTDPAFK